jgi:RNA-directed DNA polymerase
VEAKLQAVTQALRARMDGPIPAVDKWLRSVLTGYFQYHAVPGNLASLRLFLERIGWYWRRALERRSQKDRLKADRVTRLIERWLPRPYLVHPYPSERLAAKYPR